MPEGIRCCIVSTPSKRHDMKHRESFVAFKGNKHSVARDVIGSSTAKQSSRYGKIVTEQKRFQ